MFTIKQERPGIHSIYQGRFVEYLPKDSPIEGAVDRVGIYGCPSAVNEFTDLTQGSIYVMNENGKTVAFYHLKWE